MAKKPNVVPEQSMVPEPSVLPEPEDVPIPDANDLVIEILKDQTIDFDESTTDVLEILAVTGGDKKRVKLTRGRYEDGKLFSHSTRGRVAAVAEAQSF